MPDFAFTSDHNDGGEREMVARNTDTNRPCERRCTQCGEWKHHSRFHSKVTGNSSVARFSPRCRDCEQINRNETKNADRPLAIVRQCCKRDATKFGTTFEFMWTNMNYRSLVPLMRAMLTPEGLCHCCGHPFQNERDVQIEHREPPRHKQDWANLHARNLGLACGSCNRTKNHKPYQQWLDEQESTRLSNEADRTAHHPATIPDGAMQFTLFDDL